MSAGVETSIESLWLKRMGKFLENSSFQNLSRRIFETYQELSKKYDPKLAFLVCLADPEVDQIVGHKHEVLNFYYSIWQKLDSNGAFCMPQHPIFERSSRLMCFVSNSNGIDLQLRRERVKFDVQQVGAKWWEYLEVYFATYENMSGTHRRARNMKMRAFGKLLNPSEDSIREFMIIIVRTQYRSLRGLIWAIEVILDGRRSSFLSGS